MVGALMGMISSLLVFQYGQARIWYAMSRDGLFPSSFPKVHPAVQDAPPLHLDRGFRGRHPGGTFCGDRSRRSLQHRHALRLRDGLPGRDYAPAFAARPPPRVSGAVRAIISSNFDRVVRRTDDGTDRNYLDAIRGLAGIRASRLFFTAENTANSRPHRATEKMVGFAARASVLLCVALVLPSMVGAWGVNAQRLIADKAVDILPPKLRGFYEANRVRIAASVSDPIESALKNPNEARYHVLYLNRYSPFPFNSSSAQLQGRARQIWSPEAGSQWFAAVASRGLQRKAYRGVSQSRLDGGRQNSAVLAYYVAETHDPFDMTDTNDPRTGTAPGIQGRFSSSLVERYSLFFPMRPNDAFYIKDPTDNAFENCLSAHAWLEIIEIADLRARAGLGDYTDEYYDRFYNQAGAVLIRQLCDAATQVGSYWLTSWINAGKPALPQ